MLNFYEELYNSQPCEPEATEELLNGLPQLSESERNKLEEPLSLRELSAVPQQLSNGKSLGLDGLTSEFYKTFWSLAQTCTLSYKNAQNTKFYPSALGEL